jgi:hypothetical protein
MNRQWKLGIVTLLLIGCAGGFLGYRQAHQKLGEPGVKTHNIPNSIRLDVELPETVLNYISESLPLDEITTNTLPQDTSFGQKVYILPDKSFAIQGRVVLMGTDRGSMHKPQFCLEGQGWHIETSSLEQVRIERPFPYELQVVKLVASHEFVRDGQRGVQRGIYVYWFVADDALSASVTGTERMWLLAKKMLTTGVLQRWAYVSCFATCAPGQEEAAFERIRQFIAASVPEFQLYPRAPQGNGTQANTK